MPLYDIYAGITYNHTVIAADEDEALESGSAEAKERLVQYFGLEGYDPDDLTVFDSVLDLDEEGPEGGNLYVLTAVLSFDFPVEAGDEYEAEERAGDIVMERAAALGVPRLSGSDVSVWGVTAQGPEKRA